VTDSLERTVRQESAARGADWVFVHVPKTGGTTVRSALRAVGEDYGAAWIRRGHIGAREHIAAHGRTEWDELETFALVRDPFARLVSCWAYGLADGSSFRRGVAGFREWVAEDCPIPNRYRLDVGPGRRLWLHEPQASWLTDETGAIAVKTLFHLEELSSSWARIRGIVGRLGELEHQNASRHGPIESHFGELERAYVLERYAADFELLGYDTRGGAADGLGRRRRADSDSGTAGLR